MLDDPEQPYQEDRIGAWHSTINNFWDGGQGMTKEHKLLTENEVVKHVMTWLTANGYTVNTHRQNTAKGDDIAATHGNGSRIFVECKGSISQRGGKLDDWKNSAMAIFGAIKETEELRPNDRHAIAVPDTAEYRKCIGSLNNFFVRQNVSLFWVQQSGDVRFDGAPLNH